MKEVSPEKGLTEEPVALATGLSDEDAKQITAITLMRIYDVLGAILNHLDSELADAILKEHAEGRLVGPLPALNLEPQDE